MRAGCCVRPLGNDGGVGGHECAGRTVTARVRREPARLGRVMRPMCVCWRLLQCLTWHVCASCCYSFQTP